MNRHSSRQFVFWLTLLGLWALGGSALRAQAISATADFEPPILERGQMGTYSVTLSNVRENVDVPSPTVTGLGFQLVGSQERHYNINGNISAQRTLTWRVAAFEEGTFTVPPRTLRIRGQEVTIPEARLRVTPASERDQSLFRIEWQVPAKVFYVGEAIPAALQVYVRDGLQLQQAGIQENNTEGFQVDEFGEQRVRPESIEGVPFRVVSLPTVLTPIRAGEATLETSMAVAYQDPSSRQFSLRGFGPLRMSAEQRLLNTGKRTFTIQEPPAEGRPEGFNGAVGEFQVSTTLGSETVRAGEPLSLTLSISGRGNFERISAPTLPDPEGWRVYPPKVRFQPAGDFGVEGTKTFEYLLIPDSTAVSETPAIPFAAFNPQTERYVNLAIEPLPIAVTPAPPSGSAPSVYGGSVAEPEAGTELRWRPNRADLGTVREGIRPIFQRPGFWIAQGGVALAFGLALFWQKRQHRLAHDEGYARRVVGSKSVRQWARTAQEAAQRDDPEGFYSAAQRALRESAGRKFPRGHKAESLTLTEIDEVLRQHAVPEACRADVVQLFQTGDALKYARSAFPSDQLQADASRLEATLRELHKHLA